MSLTKEQVQKIARLARIEIDDAELGETQTSLNKIMNFVEQLEDVDTKGVEPMTSVVKQSLYMREDIINDGNIRDDVLKNAPESTEGFFTVPKVVE